MRDDEIRKAFRETGESCRALGSDFTARLCHVIASRLTKDGVVGNAILNWQGDASNKGDIVAIRLAGALHSLVITGADQALAQVYPPNLPPTDDDAFWNVLSASLDTHGEAIVERLQFAPQTNEIRRSSAIHAGLMEIGRRFKLPLVLSEIGASAGLNLLCDQYQHEFSSVRCGNLNSPIVFVPEMKGSIPALTEIQIADRSGCDLNPLDINSAKDMDRLRSYIWPDQIARHEQLNHAIQIGRSMNLEGLVVACEASEWLEQRLGKRWQGFAHVIFHSIAWQYFPKHIQDQCQRFIEQAGEQADATSPIAWLSVEAAGDSAEIRLRDWPDNQDIILGQADFHGRWLDWTGC
ncbi:MAG: DUF2332 family protein [Pseudomonadota bacterium]